jgi:glyoxylase-like metal-dependent hydrolase (beta-lactamase superfamily II)
VLSQPERQAQPHPAPYSMRGPGPNFRMNKIVDPRTFALIGYSIQGLFGNADRTLWLDGRPHPSDIAEHTWNGFSTGVWERGALKVTTTHMNLEEPFVRTSNFVWAANQTQARPAPFEVVDELGNRPRGWVPNYPIGTLHEDFARRVALPFEATVGGRDTVYPEFASRIARMNRSTPPGSSAPKPGPSRPPRTRRTDFEALPLRDGISMLAGPSGNVTVQATDEGVLLVDTGAAADVDTLAAAIKKLSDRPVTYIINTSVDGEHIGGNERLSQAGTDPGGNAPGNSGFRIGVAPIIAHEQVLRRVSAPTGEKAAPPFAAWPTSTYFSVKRTMFFGNDPIEIHAAPAAHTDGDSVVFFRRADVISAGDVFMTDRYPVIDLARGGSIQGVLDALNHIIDIAIPRFNQQGGTLIVPGHGRLANESDVVEYRDMATIVRDRIKAMIDSGMSVEQVKAARPTLDYDGIYGATTGAWTTDMFVEAVFRSLSR